jgi:hypothetical protein
MSNKLICAWCNTVLKECTMPPTHGICLSCLKLEKAKFCDGVGSQQNQRPLTNSPHWSVIKD